MPDEQNSINTGGGASVQGDANAGNDIIGRDQYNYYYTQQSLIHLFPLTRIVQIVKSFLFKKIFVNPLLIIGIGLMVIGLSVFSRERGREVAENRIQPTLEALQQKIDHPLVITNMYVDASVYPFDSTGVQVNRDDYVTVTLLDPSRTWNCSKGGEVGPAGFASGEFRDLWIAPKANFCELIGTIEIDGSPIQIGSVGHFTAPQSGTLHLGVNDMWPDHCREPHCFADNTGRLFVQITVSSSENSP